MLPGTTGIPTGPFPNGGPPTPLHSARSFSSPPSSQTPWRVQLVPTLPPFCRLRFWGCRLEPRRAFSFPFGCSHLFHRIILISLIDCRCLKEHIHHSSEPPVPLGQGCKYTINRASICRRESCSATVSCRARRGAL